MRKKRPVQLYQFQRRHELPLRRSQPPPARGFEQFGDGVLPAAQNPAFGIDLRHSEADTRFQEFLLRVFRKGGVDRLRDCGACEIVTLAAVFARKRPAHAVIDERNDTRSERGEGRRAGLAP